MDPKELAALKARRAQQSAVLGGNKPKRKPKKTKKPTGKPERQLDLVDMDAADFGIEEGKPQLLCGVIPSAQLSADLSSKPDTSVAMTVTNKVYEITPVPKPRQTQRDRWAKRPCVVRYRDFKDQVKALDVDVPETGCRMIFVLPMPQSWSNKKKSQMSGQPHKQRPDTDNMVKAILDAIHKEDSQIFHVEGLKFWGKTGKIIIQKTSEAVAFDGSQVIWRNVS